jgi:hypothetical protein
MPPIFPNLEGSSSGDRNRINADVFGRPISVNRKVGIKLKVLTFHDETIDATDHGLVDVIDLGLHQGLKSYCNHLLRIHGCRTASIDNMNQVGSLPTDGASVVRVPPMSP